MVLISSHVKIIKIYFYRDVSTEINVEIIRIKICIIKLLFPVKSTNYFNVANSLRNYMHNQKCRDLILTEAKRMQNEQDTSCCRIPEVQ